MICEGMQVFILKNPFFNRNLMEKRYVRFGEKRGARPDLSYLTGESQVI
jgi:hypothetical protein